MESVNQQLDLYYWIPRADPGRRPGGRPCDGARLRPARAAVPLRDLPNGRRPARSRSRSTCARPVAGPSTCSTTPMTSTSIASGPTSSSTAGSTRSSRGRTTCVYVSRRDGRQLRACRTTTSCASSRDLIVQEARMDRGLRGRDGRPRLSSCATPTSTPLLDAATTKSRPTRRR